MPDFKDMDPVEQHMHKRVELMEANELFDYFETWYEGLFGEKLRSDRPSEMSIFKRFKKTYGPDAGRIIKWFFFKHGGLHTQRTGKKVKFKISWLSRSKKHWQDEMLEELRDHLASLKRSKEVEESHTFLTAKDLLG